MITIKLRVSEKIHDNIMWFLRRFSSEELQILTSETDSTMNQKELDSAYKEVSSRNEKTISVDEFDQKLTARIIKRGS